MPATKLWVLSDQSAAMEDPNLTTVPLDFHRLAYQRKGHRVMVGVETHEIIGGDHPAPPDIGQKARFPSGWEERGALALEPFEGALVGRAVNAHIGTNASASSAA